MPRCPFQFLLPFPASRQLLRPRHRATELRPSAIFQAWCLRHLPSPLRRRLLCLRCRLQILLLHLRRHLRYRSQFHHRGHRRFHFHRRLLRHHHCQFPLRRRFHFQRRDHQCPIPCRSHRRFPSPRRHLPPAHLI